MSNTIVVPFAPRRTVPAQAWRPDEIAEIYRVIDLLVRAGLAVSMETGRSDEGDPWLAILRDDNQEAVVHIARIDGNIVAASAASERVYTGPTLADVLRMVLGAQPLILPNGGARLFLHPATLLAAFIATAFTHSGGSASDSSAVEIHADRITVNLPEASGTVVRSNDGGIYSPAFIAAAVASVAAIIAITNEGLLPSISDGPLQAGSRMLAAAETHAATEQIFLAEDVEDFLRPAGMQQTSLEVPYREGEVWAEPRSGQEVHIRLAVAPSEATKMAEDTQLNCAPQILNCERADDEVPWASLSLAPMPVLSAYEPNPWNGGVVLTQASPSKHDVAAKISAVNEGAAPMGSLNPDMATAQSMKPAQADGAELTVVQFSEGETFYWQGASLLGLLEPDGTTANAAKEVDSVSAQIQPSLTNASNEAVDSVVVKVPKEASAETKALVLTEFAHGSAHEFNLAPSVVQDLRSAVEANHFMASVDRVILFEGDSVKIDMFMLMPGVAMVRSDLVEDKLLQTAHVQQADIVLPDGAMLRLLGVVDI